MFIGKIAAPRLFESTSNTDTSSIKDSRFQSIDRSSSPMPTNNYEEECNKLRKKVKKLKAEIKEYKEALEALKNQ